MDEYCEKCFCKKCVKNIPDLCSCCTGDPDTCLYQDRTYPNHEDGVCNCFSGDRAIRVRMLNQEWGLE